MKTTHDSARATRRVLGTIVRPALGALVLGALGCQSTANPGATVTGASPTATSTPEVGTAPSPSAQPVGMVPSPSAQPVSTAPSAGAQPVGVVPTPSAHKVGVVPTPSAHKVGMVPTPPPPGMRVGIVRSPEDTTPNPGFAPTACRAAAAYAALRPTRATRRATDADGRMLYAASPRGRGPRRA